MKREFLKTGDGSITIHLPQWNEQYHSKHGAIQEALHVFIEKGFLYVISDTSEICLAEKPLHILEIGFGTGLNALLTNLQTQKSKQLVNYTGIEAFPVTQAEIEFLNYPQLLNISEETFQKLHRSPWETNSKIDSYFQLQKRKTDFRSITDREQYHLIYFDAFGARVQPELWTVSIFQKMYDALMFEGVLVTYAAKGSVRRAMQEVGFVVERLEGPPGKREMLRATKKNAH